jgi:hypothetical protein
LPFGGLALRLLQLGPDLICRPSYGTDGQPFISFREGEDIDAFALDAQCITALGTCGCAFEMQLEAMLKALWPSEENNLERAQKDLDITFYGDLPPHGDEEHAAFLRGTNYHPSQPEELSVLAIILLTDEEDCSAGAQGNLDFLQHPYAEPPPANLRCYYDTVNNTGNKYPVERYVDALKLLRPGYEQLVVFAAIAGIPTDVTESEFDRDGDGMLDDQERDAYLQAILDHPSMQERIREDGQNLEPACNLPNPEYDPQDPNSEEFITRGLPARRITEVARGFGQNGVVSSICRESFTGAVDKIVRAIARRLGER